MGLFQREKVGAKTQLPVWFMRQAGRYHAHYQNIKKNSDFMTMCKTPELACEVTMGPIEDFDFDAAILFSDLLFPLEQMGMGLIYDPGPKLDKRLESKEDIKKLQEVAPAQDFYQFQKQACALLKEKLPTHKTLLGFVGAPFTLYTYACEGSHAGNLVNSKKGLYQGNYHAFVEKLLPGLLEEMFVQAQGGADALCLFDTAAGELSILDYQTFVVPSIKNITKKFKEKFPDKKIVYYSKHTHVEHYRVLNDPNIDVLGVDWRHDLASFYREFSEQYYIQGNIDPVWLHLPWEDLKRNVDLLWNSMLETNTSLDKWIFGLGHGVIIQTPEENVRRLVQHIHQNYLY